MYRAATSCGLVLCVTVTDLQQLALVAVVLATDKQLVDARTVRNLHQDEGEAAVRVDLGGRVPMSGQNAIN